MPLSIVDGLSHKHYIWKMSEPSVLNFQTDALNRRLYITRTNANAQRLIQIIINYPVAILLQLSQKIDGFWR